MMAIEIGIGVTAMGLLAVVVHTYLTQGSLQGPETVFGLVALGGVAWFIARLCGAA